MRPTLGELAQQFGLTLQGDGALQIEGVCALAPGKPRYLSFCADPRLRGALAKTACAAVIVTTRDAPALASRGVAALVTRDPSLAFAQVAARFDEDARFAPGRHPAAIVAEDARIGADCWIGAGAVIGAGAEIGAGSFIGPGCIVEPRARIGAQGRLVARVYVGRRCVLGARAHVQPGAVIGGRGFGLARAKEGWIEVPQLGAVSIGDDVEIGANTCIDRGALDDTVIEDGVKLDNQIQIAHNCRIGTLTAVAACVGIAGSVTIGKRCMIGGAVGIGGHLEIVDDVVLLAGTMVSNSILEKGAYGSAMTALPVRDWRRMVGRFRRWSLVENRLRRIERDLKISEQENLSEGYGLADGEQGE